MSFQSGDLETIRCDRDDRVCEVEMGWCAVKPKERGTE